MIFPEFYLSFCVVVCGLDLEITLKNRRLPTLPTLGFHFWAKTASFFVGNLRAPQLYDSKFSGVSTKYPEIERLKIC